MYNIKKLSSVDYFDLVNIWERSVRSTHDFLLEKDILFYKSRIPIYFDHIQLYGTLTDDGIIKGFVGVSKNKIEMLFVDSFYFKLGIGNQLLKYATDHLKLKLVDVNEQNINALNFYKKNGFTEYRRSELDGEGNNYPILYLKKE